MDRTNELRTEDIREIGRYGRKAAAIHRKDDAEEQYEQRNRSCMRDRGCRRVQNNADEEKSVVRILPSDEVGQRRPEEAPANIEQRQQSGKSGCNRRDGGELRCIKRCKRHIGLADQPAPKYLLQHG